MFKKILNKIVGDPTQKYIHGFQPIIDDVEMLEAEFEKLSDDALKNKTAEFKDRYQNGDSLDEILPEAFALVREVSKRTTGLRHYDVQILGGILLHRGEVVEMRTGEGKTLVATLPLYLNALTSDGVHLVTVNEYLARRDGGWMGKIFYALGLTVGCIGPQQFSALYDPDYVNPGAELEDERLVHWRPCTRPEAYKADITYGISSEFGFDYLRDNMVNNRERLVQRELNYAVIDEVDNILIDEARTPLIISGPSGTSSKEYVRFADYVRGLKENTAEEEEEPTGHYDIDEKSRSISLTEMGIAAIEDKIPEINPDAGDSLYDPRFYQMTYYVDNALKAQYLYKRDKQYVVQDGEVIIVDDFTGRLMAGRRYSDGLHEAIEAKEGVQVKRENVTVATITLQNYFRLYEKLAGMTGTAMTDAEEFDEVYELEVTPLPTNVDFIVERGTMGLEERRHKVEGAEEIYYVHPDQPEKKVFAKRIDYADRVYKDLEAKDRAIAEEIKSVKKTGRPILVGTTSVEHSEQLHRTLNRMKVDHAVLNAKIHQSEALIVAQAGRKGAVTISTNMAGRGTDILLGGNPEGLAAEALEKEMFDRQDLLQLAIRLLTEGEEKAREYVRGNRKLTADLIPALQETKAEFDEALVEIEKSQVIGYLALKFQEHYNIDFSDVRHVLRLVRGGQLAEAREHLDNIDKDVAMVDEAVRLTGLYNRYERMHSDPRQAAQFISETLFEKLYNSRAALIRAALEGDRAEADRLVKTIPGLEAHHLEKIESIKSEAEKERREIWELGGLHVIGSERHESRRIDNQLRGRAARQGDPGSSRFFLSVEDDLMRRFGGERLKSAMSRINMPDDLPIEAGILDRIIENSQERIEGYNFDIRKNVVEYDDVMSKQRAAIYNERRAILLGESIDLDDKVNEAFTAGIEELINNYIDDYLTYVRGEVERAVADFSTDATDAVNVNGVLVRLRGLLPGVIKLDRSSLADTSPDQITRQLMTLARENLDEGRNLYQFLQAAGRFIPLLPPIPNLGALLSGRRSGQLQARENLHLQFVEQIEKVFEEFLAGHIEESERQKIWNRTLEGIEEAFSGYNVEGLSNKAIQGQQAGFLRQVDEILRNLLLDSLSALKSEQLSAALNEYIGRQQKRWKEQIGQEEYENFQRLVLLDAIDREWRDYLIAMDDLRREIGLEAIAQRDPKVEYKRRSFQMFAEMRHNIEKNIVDSFFRRLASHQDFIMRREEQAAYQERMSQAGYQVVQREKGKGVELRRDLPKVGRNDPCPCGSGKKYKNCHMRKDQAKTAKSSRRVRSR